MDGNSAAVMASLLYRFPGNRSKSAVEEGVVDDIVLAILAFDDPVTGANLTLPQIGNYRSSLCALGRFYQQRSSCPKSIHGSSVDAQHRQKSFQQPTHKDRINLNMNVFVPCTRRLRFTMCSYPFETRSTGFAVPERQYVCQPLCSVNPRRRECSTQSSEFRREQPVGQPLQ
jgi:hypothetical protein